MRNSSGRSAELNRGGVVMNGSAINGETCGIEEVERQARELGIPLLLAKALLSYRNIPQGAEAETGERRRVACGGEFSEANPPGQDREDLPRLRRCYDFFRADILDDTERWRWALAAYKGGIQPVENALKRAKRELAGFKAWRNWNVSRIFLENCDIMQISTFVARIWSDYEAGMQKRAAHFADPVPDQGYMKGEMAEIAKGSRA